MSQTAEAMAYRGWWIAYDPPPIPSRNCDWGFWHDDYDGAPDAGDSRCGHAPTLEEARADIDFWHEEQGPVTYPTIKGTSWILMRVGDPVPVQNYGHITRAYAAEKANKYAAARLGDYELVRIEHIEREAERITVVRAEGGS